MLRRAFRRLALALALLLALLAGPAFASVEIAFYSRELGTNFPHAFIVLKGSVDSTGEAVDTSYGFTAHSVTPALLMGSVRGEIVVEGERQIARSDRQFDLTLTDDQYRTVMGVVEEWRNREQPSYNLNRRNCVHFVAAVAQALGLDVEHGERLMKKPRSFLQLVRAQNPRLAVSAPPAGPSEGTPPRP